MTYTVTCRLTACTPGSAPGPTLGIKYGKTLPLPDTDSSWRRAIRHRSLCSLGSHQLVKPWHNLSFGSLLHIFGIHCLPIVVKRSQFLLSDVISKRTTFSQLFQPPSDPPANASWFFLTYRRYINHLLTYLLNKTQTHLANALSMT